MLLVCKQDCKAVAMRTCKSEACLSFPSAQLRVYETWLSIFNFRRASQRTFRSHSSSRSFITVKPYEEPCWCLVQQHHTAAPKPGA